MSKTNPTNTHILIPDGDSTWALPVIKCLAFRTDYKIFVLSAKENTAAKFSKTTSYYKYYPKSYDNSWLNILNQEIESKSIDVVLPIAEPECLFLIQNKHLLSDIAKVIPMASIDNFETAIDKNKLGIFCEQHQIAYPKSQAFSNSKDFISNGNHLTYPLLIKPLHDKGGNGIIKFDDKTKFEKFIHENFKNNSFFAQEFVEGYDIDCSVLCDNGKVLTHTIQKGFLTGKNPYSPYIGIAFLQNDEVLELTKKLMEALNWSGVAHIDLRYDKKRGEYKILEVNARFWGSVEASRIANINFPVLICDYVSGKAITHQSYNPISYLRFRGLIKYISKHPSYIFYLRSILKSTEAKSVLKDPLPTIYKFREWLGRKLYRKNYFFSSVTYNLLKPFS
ncbi:ATP-grasp domain-containing protein [Subsaxibacter sp. CAU 1640]|uniref:ATP-grasp domain-containing protein n=1 Tax=Subsaxibacter sp. CAU 1640 TaxID=2933271 RepID=UPI002005340E|nr:ATP-grasp domain-containing protein [Subsaxibacter sp. CAU 1640]MCK7591678.1 ATP-grasp domain-containing protein [Subsaxibacter sp. CAU 1640]